jgi:diguanylate cyclase (GGDEF)-like protein
MESTSPHIDNTPPSCLQVGAQCPLHQQLMQLQHEVGVLKEQVRTDALTGLYNFRFFSDTLPLEIERARRSFQPLSLIMLDIDHFKRFNDTWGHELGNQALVHISRLINLTVRKLDYACRFGGEEFVILLPNTDLRQAMSVAERLREMIETTPLITEKDSPITITASLGVDEFRSHHSDTPEGFVERVDAWLYSAKHAGRNCVVGPVKEPMEHQTSVSSEEKDALFGAFGDES